MNSCCCAHCRDLGFFGFELLRELTSLLARAVNGGSLPAWCDEKKLLARIDEEERFHSSQFAAHQSEASSTAEHCRRHLLSTLSDERFRCACTHGRADGGDVPELEMHEERIRRTQHRAANSTTDWESTCMICADGDEDEEKTGRMYCCAHCRSVIHKKCGIKKDRWDFPFDDDASEWICPMCADIESSLRHDSRCLECEGLPFLLRDLTTLANLAVHQQKGTENEELSTWIRESVAHAADLLRKYRAHKIRDSNQDQFQRLNLKMLEAWAAVKLSDWWGKIGHRRHHTACCEFPQGGIGMHGSYYVFRNPAQCARNLWTAEKGMKWDSYPPPFEAGGPEFICEFHRSACNDATQASFHTAAVRTASDDIFFSTKPFLKYLDGETTDGCQLQYNSTLPALYNILNKYLKRKCTKESGEGKDRVDSNGSNDQPKISAELNRKGGRIESAANVTNAVDKDRPRGNVTAETEFEEDSKTDVKIPPIYRFKDHKFYDCEGPGLCLWEFYSALLSQEAGKHVGLGPGWRLTDEYLKEKHAFGSVKHPKAKLSHNDLGFKTGSATTNPLGLLSYEQRKAAQSTVLERQSTAKDERTAKARRLEEMLAKHHNNALLVCDKCGAKFQRQTWLNKHVSSNCGRHLKRVQRRQQLINESVEKRLEVLDEAELQEARARHATRSGTFTITLSEGRLGWVLHAKVGDSSMPLEDATVQWVPVVTASEVKPNDRVRCSAERFEADAKKAFGMHWRECYFYGYLRRRIGRAGVGIWEVEYDSEDNPSQTHFSHLERAISLSENDAPAVGKAVIHALDLDGTVARQGAYCGLTVEAVDGSDVTAVEVEAVITAGIRDRKSVEVTLRRPAERRPRKGGARSANNENEAYDWHPDVEAEAIKLASNPMNAKRDNVVFEAIEAKYKHRMSGGRRMMPPPEVVKNLCKREWAKGVEKKSQEAQNAAAAAVAAVERGGGDDSDGGGDEDGDDDDGDGSADGSDNGENVRNAPRPGAGGTGDMDASANDGGDSDAGSDSGDVVDALDLPELRTKLRELGERATVTNSDLGTFPRTSAAQGGVLRTRLRAAFAAL